MLHVALAATAVAKTDLGSAGWGCGRFRDVLAFLYPSPYAQFVDRTSFLLGLVGTLAAVGGTYLAWWQVRLLRRDRREQRGTDEPWPAPRQLPADVARLVGRASDLAALDTLVSWRSRLRPGATRIAVITGPPGVGKTALTVHWAHRVRRRFAGGDLYVNLRGYDAGPRVEPGEALEGFLRALRVPADQIPPDLAARAALYRTALQGRPVLVVLDNAATAEQVRLLLPGTPGCLVVVTSRSRLSGLVARDGARPMSLDPLPEADSIRLLRQIAGAARVDAELDAATELARLCGCLPLALRIAADRVTNRPRMRLVDLVATLASREHRLDVLATLDDETTAVRAVFSWSYRALPPDAARAFRLLGLHAGPDISVPAAAALVGTTTGKVPGLLNALTGAHLLEETGTDRYRFHDLLRVYATDCAASQESALDRAAAVKRVLTWHLYTTAAAGRAIDPLRQAARAPLGTAPSYCEPLSFATREQALAWCEEEYLNLIAAVRQASEVDEYEIAWKLPTAMWDFFMLRKPWDDWIATHRIALTAARRINDRLGEAVVLNLLGGAYRELGRDQDGLECRRQSLAILREIGSGSGSEIEEGSVLSNLGHAYLQLQRFGDALEHTRQGLAIWRRAGDRWGEGWTLSNLGLILTGLRRYDEAIDQFHQALAIHCEIGNRLAEGATLQGLAKSYHRSGRYEEAFEHFQRTLVTAREVGDRWNEAQTLCAFGDALHDTGRLDAADERWRQSLAIYEALRSPYAVEPRARLDRHPVKRRRWRIRRLVGRPSSAARRSLAKSDHALSPVERAPT